MKRFITLLAFLFIFIPWSAFATVSDTETPLKIYTSGSTTEYVIPFEYISDDDIIVTLYDPDTAAEISQTLDVDYTIVDSTVTYSTAPGSEYYVLIQRVTPFTQEASFQSGQAPPLSRYESAFDKLTYQTQDLNERLERALLIPGTSSLRDLVFPDPSFNAAKGIRFKSDGTGIEGYEVFEDGLTINIAKISDYDSFEDMISEVGSTEKTIIIDTAVTMTTSGVIPSTMTLDFHRTGCITLGAYNLTIQSSESVKANRTQIFNENSTGNVSFSTASKVYPEWWGTGAAALNNAIASIDGVAGTVSFASGLYSIASGVSKTLTASQKWIAEGPCTIQYTGSALTNMITLELGGDFSMDGPFILDSNLLAGTAIRITNDTSSMTDAVNLYMRNVKAIDCYSDTNSRSSYGILVYGAFNQVKLDMCGASNISRASGLTGSYCAGIVYAHKDTTCYAKNVSIIDPYIDTVTSDDSVSSGSYLDMDGLSITGPAASANSGVKMDTTLMVRGGTFVNCSGRSIKTQMESNTIDGITIIRNSSGKKAMASGQEIDFQYGSGVLTNFKIRYGTLSGGATPFPTSWAICNASIRNYATEWGSLVVSNGEIVNDVPQGTDPLPYFVTFSYVSGNFQNITIENNTFLGSGNVDLFLYGDLTYVDNVTCSNNYINDLGQGFVVDTGYAGTCYVYASGNHNNGTARYLLTGAAYPYPILTASGNSGFTEGDGTINTFNTIRGTSGGLKTRYSEATANITASASVTITLSVPTGCRLLGTQLRVDSALATGETWDAAYSGGCTTSIATAQAVAQNTKVSVLYDESAASAITSNTTNIAITKNGGGSFTAQGTIRAIVYYEALATMGSL